MKFLPYDKNLKQFSRDLRNNSTLSEVLLWNELKQRSLKGYQFNRQKPLGSYIVDFYCKSLSLVIEIDGCTHDSEDAVVSDLKRQEVLEEMGLKLLRFNDLDVKRNLAGVLKVIEKFMIAFEEGGNPPCPL